VSSPDDPKGGSIGVTAKSSSTAPASCGLEANTHPAGWDDRGNITGTSITMDVNPAAGWSRGYLEFLIGTSEHPASGGRPAGNYYLSYRFTPGGTASRNSSGTTGIITVPVTSAWQACTLTPSDDIAALWPDLDYRDFSLWNLTFSAVSLGDLAGGHFAFLRFSRSISGQAFVTQQQAMMAGLASAYPDVTQIQGTECGPSPLHVNWFGPDVTLPDYTGVTNYQAFAAGTVIPAIHSGGGLASLNHPFGYNDGPLLSASAQDAKVASTASALLPANGVPACYGADLIEVGYKLRGNCDTAHHLALWDVMSRNALFLTGNGVSDDHSGSDWATLGNNWVTSAWAPSTGLADLLAALAAGRSWCGSLPAYRGAMDLLVDGTVPMGAVSVSQVTSRSLAATATQMPAGSTLQILQGAADYAGQGGLGSNVQVIGSWTAAQLASGTVTQSVDTTAGSFVRTQILSSSGAAIAASNPVWLLTSPPPGGIPAARAA
jgi:hypothetical protein